MPFPLLFLSAWLQHFDSATDFGQPQQPNSSQIKQGGRVALLLVAVYGCNGQHLSSKGSCCSSDVTDMNPAAAVFV
jgi:hypothetical protein